MPRLLAFAKNERFSTGRAHRGEGRPASYFSVQGPRTGRDSLLLTVGASLLWTDRLFIYAYYDGELCRENYESNTVTAGVHVQF